MPSTAADVVAVAVTFKPDEAVISEVLERAAPQVGNLVVLDNATPATDGAHWSERVRLPDGVEVELRPTNAGLGAAYNRAVAIARGRGAQFVLLLDQDSLLEPGCVDALLRHADLRAARGPVGAVGPTFVDARSGERAPFVRFGFPLNSKSHAPSGGDVDADFLISSGSLIPLSALDAAGPFDEGLFIDSVDMEWCFRARAAGLQLVGVADARMLHTIGDELIELPGGATMFVHSPLRLYMMTRNRVALWRRRGTPRVWTAQDVPRMVLKLARMTAFARPRAVNARAMLAGARDGWRGMQGPPPGARH
ncbi:glycosyltransferase family 2 protein [Agrococcus sp. TF02-05]|uniref:glycosyltransferase family 2 protein n=1 Tax=Agrococcus sp. TF02-05 TaxID=2815211 RepID=UPI001AA16533|nr:glycosyltransferase family 2 protein [Agrococcus sp. TF02-05]MBO1770724.1 glycosyltransferase family 2 protein [Agrococcus sp. TF02-05]